MDSMGKREMVAAVGTDRGRGKRERERGKGPVGGGALPFSVSDSQFCQQLCPFHPLHFLRGWIFFPWAQYIHVCVRLYLCVSCAFRTNAVRVWKKPKVRERGGD